MKLFVDVYSVNQTQRASEVLYRFEGLVPLLCIDK
jgi:hypothetical protein